MSSLRFVGSAVTRLRLPEGFAPPDFSGSVRDGILSCAFTDYLSPGTKGTRSGFVRAEEPLALPVDFSDVSTWILLPYVSLAWREDNKKVPAKKLKAATDAAAKNWCRENQRERCPGAVRTDLKDAIEADMLPRCMPTSKTVGIVWNTQENWILLSTASAPQVEAIRKGLHRALGLVATPEAPDEGLDADTFERLGGTEPLVLSFARPA